MKIAVVSGGFDPVHSGHIAYMKSAATFGDKLYVCLNSDEWLIAKKGKPFMSFEERKSIIQELVFVDKVISFDDSDGSCKNGLLKIIKNNPNDEVIFCNGGDRDIKNIPEKNIDGLEFAFGVGGDKKVNSSSSILQGWKTNTETRKWGSFATLLSKPRIKVKELVIAPHQGISFQKHNYRSEFWYVYLGSCNVYIQLETEKKAKLYKLNENDNIFIPLRSKHQLINPTNSECVLIEIQYGERVDEFDIERYFFYPETP